MSVFIPWAKVAGFMAELRDVGFEAKYLIRRAIGEEDVRKKQFIIAMFASKKEILGNDRRAIQEYSQYMLECDDNDTFHSSQRYILRNRIITLLNSPWDQKHGEARLFDPDGTILSDVLHQQPNRTKENYLAQLRDSFKQQFGNDETPIILMFSYFIPCTLENYQCARVINEYAKRNSETIFVAYQTVYCETDSQVAFQQMVGEKVKIIPRMYIEDNVNTEIRRIHAASRHYNNAVTYHLPKGWLPEACKVDDCVFKQLTRKTHKVDKRNDRQFEESTPYRDFKNKRRSHRSHTNRCDLSDACDDSSYLGRD